MKNKSAIPSFFWHFLSEVAIQEGWDFESEMIDSLDKIKDEMAFQSRGETPTKVTVADLIQVTRGIYPESFKQFCIDSFNYINSMEDTVEGHEPIMVSMHSGSSDYFTWGMLKDFVESL